MSGVFVRLAREPLVHFLLIGVGLFVLDASLRGSTAEPKAGESSQIEAPREPIVIDDGVRAGLIRQFVQTHEAEPTPEQLDALIERWIDDEVLYREGIARGLAQDDPVIRSRIATQMAYVLRSSEPLSEPSDRQLREWFEAHRERFVRPERIDFTQVFVGGHDSAAQARARQLLGLLEGGADPGGLGDTFSGGRRFRGRKLADLQEQFGIRFTAGLEGQPVGTWTLRHSDHGLHLVRVDRRAKGEAPPLEEIRDQVEHDWREEQQARALEQAVRGLRAQWEIER